MEKNQLTNSSRILEHDKTKGTFIQAPQAFLTFAV